jgi:hypothetical protein
MNKLDNLDNLDNSLKRSRSSRLKELSKMIAPRPSLSTISVSISTTLKS